MGGIWGKIMGRGERYWMRKFLVLLFFNLEVILWIFGRLFFWDIVHKLWILSHNYPL
jgi:predicted transglutaminase-like protease